MTYATCPSCRKTFNDSAGDMGVWDDGKFICLMCDDKEQEEFDRKMDSKHTTIIPGDQFPHYPNSFYYGDDVPDEDGEELMRAIPWIVITMMGVGLMIGMTLRALFGGG